MEDRWEETLFGMAGREQIAMPDSLSARIEEILCQPHKRRFRMNWKKGLLLAAALTMLVSATAVASVGALRERMEAMNREKMETYFTQIYTTKVGFDNYNRPYSETERERMEQLRSAYEKEACFPKGELTMLDVAEEYKGKGVAFLGDTTTFFFPDREMSDEELLRIIDFLYKRDYSLQKMNEMIAAGEAQMPEIEEEKIEATDETILASDVVYEPSQELTIPYTGKLELDLTIAAGQRELFLAGFNSVHRMEIGSSDSELFFDDFGVETRILAMCQDADGDVYMALWQWEDENAPEHRILTVWVVSEEGKLLRKIDLSPYLASEWRGYTRQMVVDADGYLYLSVGGLKDQKESQECEILVLDREGGFVSRISPDGYRLNQNGGLGIGKDGKVYTYIEKYEDSGKSGRQMGIASLDAQKGALQEIYCNILPEDTIMIDIIAPGAESDFVFWGYNGIFTYNLKDTEAENILPTYDAPCDWEGARVCALLDGRIVVAKASEYRTEEHPLGKRFLAVPEKTCFYYMSSIGKE
ncbi:MAG: hypothetical protein NC416_14250 [Eubacterium sp.]|nr:hypothetical protein [Eubacterium sp.]